MKIKKPLALLSFEESLLEEEAKKARQSGYPKEVISKTKEIVLRRLKDESRPPVKNVSAFFQSILVRVLWNLRETPKSRENFRKIKNRILLQSIKTEMKKAGFSEPEITEKIRKELRLDLGLTESN